MRSLALLALLCAGWAFEEVPVRQHSWHVLSESARVTFYGPAHVPGTKTASGERYDHNLSCALGPRLLDEARRQTGLVWGMRVKITDLLTGRSGVFRVNDTGLPALDVDLPDAVWQQVFGYEPAGGVFRGRVEVLR